MVGRPSSRSLLIGLDSQGFPLRLSLWTSWSLLNFVFFFFVYLGSLYVRQRSRSKTWTEGTFKEGSSLLRRARSTETKRLQWTSNHHNGWSYALIVVTEEVTHECLLLFTKYTYVILLRTHESRGSWTGTPHVYFTMSRGLKLLNNVETIFTYFSFRWVIGKTLHLFLISVSVPDVFCFLLTLTLEAESLQSGLSREGRGSSGAVVALGSVRVGGRILGL